MASFPALPRTLPPLLLLPWLLLCSPLALAVLFRPPPIRVSYHHGPLLAGPLPLRLAPVFYGDFEPSHRSTLTAFLSSLSPSSAEGRSRRYLRSSLLPVLDSSSVSSWWSITRHFSDLRGLHVSQTVLVDEEIHDSYSLGRSLTSADMDTLASKAAKALGPNFLIVIFTSADVIVDGFCMHSCGGHSHIEVVTRGSRVPGESNAGTATDSSDMVSYLWVGNPEHQCPGFCAWPFAKAQYGPDMAPFEAPNGVGVDGMVISLAKLLVGAATNPMGNAFYEGDEHGLRREAGGMCPGVFGAGAYPGFPGEVLRNEQTGASFNMEGHHGTQFLVPWIWNPASQSCAGQG